MGFSCHIYSDDLQFCISSLVCSPVYKVPLSHLQGISMTKHNLPKVGPLQISPQCLIPSLINSLIFLCFHKYILVYLIARASTSISWVQVLFFLFILSTSDFIMTVPTSSHSYGKKPNVSPQHTKQIFESTVSLHPLFQFPFH